MGESIIDLRGFTRGTKVAEKRKPQAFAALKKVNSYPAFRLSGLHLENDRRVLRMALLARTSDAFAEAASAQLLRLPGEYVGTGQFVLRNRCTWNEALGWRNCRTEHVEKANHAAIRGRRAIRAPLYCEAPGSIEGEQASRLKSAPQSPAADSR